VAAHVPPGVERVLDVGCAAGAFGHHLKTRCGVREVWGIELNPEVVGFARERLDQVLEGDMFERFDDAPDGYFDLVTFCDVLEHVTRPDEALRRVARHLRRGGHVLAAIPNLRHWIALRDIVWHGKFEYADQGIFDRTHVRFFTKRSLPALFDSAGYEIVRLHGLNPIRPPELAVLNFLTGNRFEDCRYLQFAVLARPRPA
jgi:2-polyprenyl-3-methyl-5-hydroxy-6-metoxy-1,4-benzoquinol methylase